MRYRIRVPFLSGVDDGAAGHHVVEVGDGSLVNGFLLDDRDVRLVERGQEGVDVGLAAGAFLNKLQDVRLEGQDRPNLAPGQSAEAVDLGQRLGFGHRDRQRVVHLEHRQALQSLGLSLPDQSQA